MSGKVVDVRLRSEDAQERRMLRRELLSAADNFFLECVTLKSDRDSRHHRLSVRDLHAFGALIEGEWPDGSPEKGALLKDVRIHCNTSLVGHYQRAYVTHVSPQKHGVCLGVVFDIERRGLEHKEPGTAYELRKESRIRIVEKFAPIATSPHPFKYDDPIVFRLCDISRSGARLATSTRNRLLLQGSRLNGLIISIPSFGEVKLDASVCNVRHLEASSELEVGVKFVRVSEDFNRGFVKYIINFNEISENNVIAEIRRAGFYVKYVKSHLDFTHASSPSDYEGVLKLRLEAYARAGKTQASLHYSKMSDVYDLTSHIVIAKCQGDIVGSLRITACELPSDRFEIEESFAIPQFLPRSEILECSRLCVATAFENTDLILGLIERCTSYAIKNQIKYIITSCTENQLDRYAKLGFRQHGKPFPLLTLNNIPHYFLILDTRAAKEIHRINPLYWTAAYRDVVSHLRYFGFGGNQGPNRLKSGVGRVGFGLFKSLQAKRRRRQ